MTKGKQGDYSESLFKIISGINPLTLSSAQKIVDECVIQKYTKTEYLAKTSAKNSLEYILIEGILQRYNMSFNGEFVTLGFYFPPCVVTPNFSRTLRGRSMFFLQSLTDSTIAELEAEKLDKLRREFADIQSWGNRVIELELSRSLERETSFRSQSARERLLDLRKEFPNIENLVSHTFIASYLGVTPVSLSRLRHELARSQ